MVYYSTPLFSIQEAVKSDSSLPAKTQIYQDPVKSLDERYLSIISQFKQSETKYREEIRALYGVLGLFDPVYDAYFDNSYDDITDEMVSFRKSKNQELKQNVKDIAQHHRYLYDYLHDTNIDKAMSDISEWILHANQLYVTYMSLYRVDVNHSKTETYIRKLPLIKLGHLFNFISSLKELVFHFQSGPSTATLISNLEIGLHQLSKSLNHSKQLTIVNVDIDVSNCKDVSSLKPISVSLSMDNLDLENSIKCKLFYFQKVQSVSMNFERVEIAVVKTAKFKQIVLLQINENGKMLLFSPISQNEFKFIQKVDDKTLQFDNYKNDVQLFFTTDENTNIELFNSLMIVFPPSQKFAIENQYKGIGINQLSPLTIQIPRRASTVAIESPLSFIPNDVRTPSSTPSSAKIPNTKIPKRSNGTQIVEQFINDIMEDNNSSCDEEMGDYDQMSVSLDASPAKETISAHSESETQSISADNMEIDQNTKQLTSAVSYQSTSSLPSIVKKNSSSLSISSNTSTKPRTFMGKLSNILRRDNSSNASLILEQSASLNLNKNSSSTSPTSSTSSTSSYYSLLHSINNSDKCSSFELPSAKVSFWKNQSWTDGLIKSIKLLNIETKGKYLALYDNMNQSTPSSLIKIISSSTCQSYSLDLHFTSVNQDNFPVVVLLRASNLQNQNILKRAIEDYDFKPMSGSSSSVSVGSNKTIGGLKNAISNSSSWQSIKSDNTKSSENVSWNGLGSICILNNGKMRKSERSVISVTTQQQFVTIELTGYEFGKIDIQLRKNQISKFSSKEGLKILVNDISTKYVLGFDTVDQLNEFHSVCI